MNRAASSAEARKERDVVRDFASQPEELDAAL